MEAVFALIEDRAPLIDRAGLDDIVLQLWVVALGAPFLYHHLRFPPLLPQLPPLVPLQPLLVALYGQFGFHYLAWVRERYL